ncbi:hypothetical protein CHS0354_032557 [Potamilus streckersoni]|uniref:Uncharacterized protein n=1 Tax=Potamilus streckersoni TaxID=2493646 RepID=A0AAE0SQ76_9BIVA|nr:hypothetical protein CHS0354_032557 [Potamilus streckersoni]
MEEGIDFILGAVSDHRVKPNKNDYELFISALKGSYQPAATGSPTDIHLTGGKLESSTYYPTTPCRDAGSTTKTGQTAGSRRRENNIKKCIKQKIFTIATVDLVVQYNRLTMN